MISCDHGTAAATSWSEGSCRFSLPLCWSLALAYHSVCPQLSQRHGYSTCTHYAASKCKCCCPFHCPSQVAHKVLAHAATACKQAGLQQLRATNTAAQARLPCSIAWVQNMWSLANAEHMVTCKCISMLLPGRKQTRPCQPYNQPQIAPPRACHRSLLLSTDPGLLRLC